MPDFPVFDNAETVLAIAVPGGAAWTRKQFDELTDWVNARRSECRVWFISGTMKTAHLKAA